MQYAVGQSSVTVWRGSGTNGIPCTIRGTVSIRTMWAFDGYFRAMASLSALAGGES